MSICYQDQAWDTEAWNTSLGLDARCWHLRHQIPESSQADSVTSTVRLRLEKDLVNASADGSQILRAHGDHAFGPPHPARSYHFITKNAFDSLKLMTL